MSAVLARRNGIKRAYPIKASTTMNASVAVFLTSGLAVPFASADGTSKFCGVSTFDTINSGADGEAMVEVEHQEFALLNGGDITDADTGSTAYFSQALIVSTDSSSATRPIAGTITGLEGDLVWIQPAVI